MPYSPGTRDDVRRVDREKFDQAMTLLGIDGPDAPIKSVHIEAGLISVLYHDFARIAPPAPRTGASVAVGDDELGRNRLPCGCRTTLPLAQIRTHLCAKGADGVTGSYTVGPGWQGIPDRELRVILVDPDAVVSGECGMVVSDELDADGVKVDERVVPRPGYAIRSEPYTPQELEDLRISDPGRHALLTADLKIPRGGITFASPDETGKTHAVDPTRYFTGADPSPLCNQQIHSQCLDRRSALTCTCHCHARAAGLAYSMVRVDGTIEHRAEDGTIAAVTKTHRPADVD